MSPAAAAADDDDEDDDEVADWSSTSHSQWSAPFGSKLTDRMKTVGDRRLKAGRWRRPHALCGPPPHTSPCQRPTSSPLQPIPVHVICLQPRFHTATCPASEMDVTERCYLCSTRVAYAMFGAVWFLLTKTKTKTKIPKTKTIIMQTTVP